MTSRAKANQAIITMEAAKGRLTILYNYFSLALAMDFILGFEICPCGFPPRRLSYHLPPPFNTNHRPFRGEQATAGHSSRQAKTQSTKNTKTKNYIRKAPLPEIRPWLTPAESSHRPFRGEQATAPLKPTHKAKKLKLHKTKNESTIA